MKDLGITKGEIIIDTDMGYAFDLVLKGKEEEQVYMPLLDRRCVGKKEMIANANLFADAHNTAQACGLLPSELLRQRDELKEELAEQKRLYFKLFDEEISCMYCEAKIRRGSAIILCKECAENTEV